MEIAFIVKLQLPIDSPDVLAQAAERIHDNCESSDEVVSVVPWSRDATSMVTQLMGPTSTTLSSGTIPLY